MWPTIEAIDDAFDLRFPINDVPHLEELSKGFYDHSGGILDGCICALDEFVVRTRCPFRSEVKHQRDYCYYKGGFAIIVLAGWMHSFLSVLQNTVEAQMTLLLGVAPSCKKRWKLTICFHKRIFSLVMKHSPIHSSF